MFEAFLVDNFVFIDFNECFTWLDCVFSEDYIMDDWIIPVSLDDCVNRVFSKVLGGTDEQKEIIYNYLSSYEEKDWTHIYYKNNLIEFTKRHKKVQKLHNRIFENIISTYQEMEVDKKGNPVSEEEYFKIPENLRDKFMGESSPGKAWNKFVNMQRFYDPNDVPDTIINELKELSDIYMKNVYVRFLHLDKIYRLRNFKREVVTVIDTDSNILSLDTWMHYCINNLMKGDYGRSFEENVYIAMNSITYIITNAVTDILLYYGECSNVEESHRPRYNMKNEFMFLKLVIAKTKKRYLSRITLREGNLLKKPKYDIKGFDFKKATTSESAEKFYMSILKKYILNNDTPDLKGMINELNQFKKEIRKSIESGDRQYLPNGNAKELAAYKDPGSNQGVRGVLTWNMCEPEKLIEFPAKVSLLKMNLETEEQVADMKDKFPFQYNAIMNGIFHDDTGIFIKPRKDSRTGKMVMKQTGLKVLAIPTNEKIPEWAIPYIDYSTMVNNILAPFKSVNEIFNLPGIEEGKTGRKSTALSNIIRL